MSSAGVDGQFKGGDELVAVVDTSASSENALSGLAYQRELFVEDSDVVQSTRRPRLTNRGARCQSRRGLCAR